MRFTIKEKADYLGTLRATRVYLMETLAAWIPPTPEMEVKVLFGRHTWDMAQHADQLGKRTYELRAPLHYTLAPTDGYREFLERAASAQATPERIYAFYEVLLPALDARIHHYLASTDRLQDEPTVRILEGMLRDDARLREESAALLAELDALQLRDASSWDKLAAEQPQLAFVSPSAAAPAAMEVEA